MGYCCGSREHLRRRPFLVSFLLILGTLFVVDFYITGYTERMRHIPFMLSQTILISTVKNTDLSEESRTTEKLFRINATRDDLRTTKISSTRQNVTEHSVAAEEQEATLMFNNTSISELIMPPADEKLVSKVKEVVVLTSTTLTYSKTSSLDLKIPPAENISETELVSKLMELLRPKTKLPLKSTVAFQSVLPQTTVNSPRVSLNQSALRPTFGTDKGNDVSQHGPAATRKQQEIVRPGFAVWSESCQIPDLDPWHPTIRHLVSKSPPINCSATYPAISETRVVRDPVSGRLETTLRINPQGLRFHSLKENEPGKSMNCCYQTLQRHNDNDVTFGKNCRPLDQTGSKVVQLSGEAEEFVRVQCGPDLKNFHASVPEKESVEKRIQQLGKIPPGYSLLVVGVDATSRLNGHRQLPLTMAFLRSKMAAVEMMGFQKVGDNTFPNLVPLLSGISEANLQKNCWGDVKESLDNCPWLWREFASSGYRTFYAEDASWMSTFNYARSVGFLSPPTDYYGRPYLDTFEKILGRDKDMNCQRCMGSTSQVEAVLDWAQHFVRKFYKDPFFVFCWLNTLSHDYLNSVSAGDELFRDFFRTLDEGGHLERTLVVLMGDHGLRWGDIVQTYVGRMEERLPLLLVSMPKALEQEHPEWAENLRFNARRLVTPFDLYATFKQLLPPQQQQPPNASSQLGISLFTRVPTNRTCDDAGVAGQWCTCQQSETVSTRDPEVLHVVTHVLDVLNRNLSATPQCSPLALDAILSARLRSPLKELKSHKTSADVFDYSVTFRTKPGLAVFDTTVRFVPHKHTHEMLGEVSRFNLYGNQSWCVQDAKLRKICYCTESQTDDHGNEV